jgi:hypothetical protein
VTFNAPVNELNQNNIGQIVLAGVEDGAVFSASAATETNTIGDAPLAGGTNTGAGFTDGPDLLGATFNTANQVTYTFDEPVNDVIGVPGQSVVPQAFFIVDAAGVETCGQSATVSGNTVTVTFAGGVSASAGAGVNSDTDGENACPLVHGAFDFLGNGNSPDSVGGGPAPSTV